MGFKPRHTLQSAHAHAQQGRRPDLGNAHFRSKMEANVARYLVFLQRQGEIHDWQHEPDTFWFDKIKRGVRSYMPDFKVWDKPGADPYYVEVKGWMCPKSRTKLKRMGIYHPMIKIKVITVKEYNNITKNVAPFIPNWER